MAKNGCGWVLGEGQQAVFPAARYGAAVAKWFFSIVSTQNDLSLLFSDVERFAPESFTKLNFGKQCLPLPDKICHEPVTASSKKSSISLSFLSITFFLVIFGPLLCLAVSVSTLKYAHL